MSFASCGLPYYLGGEITNRASLFMADPATFEIRFEDGGARRDRGRGLSRERFGREMKLSAAIHSQRKFAPTGTKTQHGSAAAWAGTRSDLAHGQRGQYLVDEMDRTFDHPPRVAGGVGARLHARSRSTGFGGKTSVWSRRTNGSGCFPEAASVLSPLRLSCPESAPACRPPTAARRCPSLRAGCRPSRACACAGLGFSPRWCRSPPVGRR
jgi:hypothetical protein